MSTVMPAKTILCTWEIGGELGHISRYSAIVKALESEGHHVVLALKDLSRVYPFFKDTQATLLQAPIWLPRISMQRPIACLADTLLCMGYLEHDPLDCLVQAWESMIEMVKPDLVIFDYAPTAMLALINNPIPKILIGTGFADPVPGRPIVDWRPYPKMDDLIARQEQRVLEQINVLLERRGQPPLTYLTELFAVDQVVISNFPELDLYGEWRTGARYGLSSSTKLVDSEACFVSEKRPRILAYLKPAYPHIEILIAALAACDASVFIVCPKAPASLFTSYVGEQFQFSTDLVDLQGAMNCVDLFVGHGNATSCKEALLAGNPMVMLPIQLEQLLTGLKIQKAGFGVLVGKISTLDEMVALLNEVLSNRDSYRAEIKKLLQRYPEPRMHVAEAVIASVKELLA